MTAFSSVNTAITTVPILTTIIVNAGTYAEAVNVTKPVSLTLQEGAISFASLDDSVSTGTLLLDGITLTVGGNNSSTQFDSVISGTGSLVKIGSGTLALNANNTYGGSTTLTGGTLQAGSPQAFSTNSILQTSAGTVLQLNGNSVTFADISGAGTIENGSATNVLLTFGTATNTTYSGDIRNGGTGVLNLAKVGSGTVTLAGANTYTGTTVITGKLQAGSISAFGTNSAVTLNAAAELLMNGFNNTIGSVRSIDASSFIRNGAAGNALLTLGGNNTSTVFSGKLDNGGVGSLGIVKEGSGTFTVYNINHTLTGGFVINAGTFQPYGGGWTDPFFANVTRFITVNPGAVLETTTHSLGGLGTFNRFWPVITINNGTWRLLNEQYYVPSLIILNGGSIVGPNEMRMDGGGTFRTLASAISSTTSRINNVFNGTLGFDIEDGAAPQDLIVDHMAGGGSLPSWSKTGAGTMAISNASSHNGINNINAGTLLVLNTTGSATSTGVVNLAAGADLGRHGSYHRQSHGEWYRVAWLECG